jgi:hypothetical protein
MSRRALGISLPPLGFCESGVTETPPRHYGGSNHGEAEQLATPYAMSSSAKPRYAGLWWGSSL